MNVVVSSVNCAHLTFDYSNLATTPTRQSRNLSSLLRPRDIDIERLRGGAHAANHFAGPDIFAKQRDPAIFKLAHGAKRISLVGRLIGVEAVLRKFAGKRHIVGIYAVSRANAESFRFEAFEELLQLFLRWLRNHDAARTRFAESNLLRQAEIADSFQMAEKIEHKGLACGEQRKNRRPEIRGLLSAHWFAAFCLQDFQAHRFHVCAEIERLHIQ